MMITYIARFSHSHNKKKRIKLTTVFRVAAVSAGKLLLPQMQITAESGKDERHMAMLTREPRQPVMDAPMQVAREPAKNQSWRLSCRKVHAGGPDTKT